MKYNHCYGCGNENENGLYIKSYWNEDESMAFCDYAPKKHQCTATPKFLNGGVIATIMDCHSICTAIAHAYKMQNQPIGEGEGIWYATGNMNITYKRPTPMNKAIKLEARVVEVGSKTITIFCELKVEDKIYVEATIKTIKDTSEWMRG